MVSFGKEGDVKGPGMTMGRELHGMAEDMVKPAESRDGVYTRTRLAWGAVIAGALTSLAILILAGAFGMACDVPAYRGGPYGVGALFWSLISSVIAFFIGGMVCEYLTRRGESRLGVLHGVLAWVLAINLVAIIALPGFGLLHGFVPLDTLRWNNVVGGIDHGSVTAAAWGVFLSLFFGMIAAAAGGILGYFAFEKSRSITT